MRQYDILQKFTFDGTDVRGDLVHLHKCLEAVSDRYPYPQTVLNVLSQALTAVTLLSATIKFEGSLILQTQSNGAIHLLVAQSDQVQHIRGLAKYDEQKLQEADLLGKGRLVITLIPHDPNQQRYQGIVELKQGILAVAIEQYFAQSEQLATRLWLASEGKLSAGLLLQKMPGTCQENWQTWEHLTILAETLTEKELLHLSNQELLYRLFNQEAVRLFDPTPVSFQCRCTLEKMEQAIATYGKEAVEALLKEQQVVDVTCEFCNKTYNFDRVDIAKIFHKAQ